MRAEQSAVLQQAYSSLAQTEAQVAPLAASIHDAIGISMVYLKGHLLFLRPRDWTLLSGAITRCKSSKETLRMYKEAHLIVKKAIIGVVGEREAAFEPETKG